MLAVLSTALLVAVVLLVPATALVFTVRPRGRTALPSRPLPATLAALLVALAALAIVGALGRGPTTAVVIATVLGGSVLAWLRVARAWDVRGLAAWALSVDAGVLYLAYVAVWTVSADVGTLGALASALLWLLEAFVFTIGLGYLWEFVDVLTRRRWDGYVDTAALPAELTRHRPFVSLHVPTHNEPPELVIQTLNSLLVLDYDAYEILLVDNNTTDPALWRPVEEFCARHDRITFLHLEDWPGYKSGALNHALTVTDPRAEVIGIVDADYQVRPDFLGRCAPIFGDPAVAFVQTPQDYRGWEQAAYFRRLYFSYGYFFDVSQRSRNERNGAIFGGTMGLIRRRALEAVGGWDEWCITEDAELSLRLLKAGDRGVHVEESFGRGVMPLTFEALKRQRFRWCFGGVQLLRMHWRSLLPGRATPDNRLTPGQRWSYLVGGLQWFGDLAGVLFTAFLVIGALDAVTGDGLVVRRLSGFLLACVAVLLVLGVARALALVRRTSGASWGEALGAFGLWVALGWTVAQASSRGLVARGGVFLRTPKVRGDLSWRDAVRGNLTEIVAALACGGIGGLALVHATSTSLLVGLLLLAQAAGYAAAPVNSMAAIRSELPEELRRRRRWAHLRSWTGPVRRSGLLLATSGVALTAFVVFAAPVGGPDLTHLPDHALTTPLHRSREARPIRPSTSVTVGAVETSRAPATSPRAATASAAATRPTRAAQPTQAAQPHQVTPSAQPTQAQPTQAQPTQAQPTQPSQATQPPQPSQAPTTRATGQPTAKPSQAKGGQPSGTPSHP